MAYSTMQGYYFPSMVYYLNMDSNGSNLIIEGNYQRTNNVEYIASYLETVVKKQYGMKMTRQAIAAICTASLYFGVNPTRNANGTTTTMGAFNQVRESIYSITSEIPMGNRVKWLDAELALLLMHYRQGKMWFNNGTGYASWSDFTRSTAAVVTLAQIFLKCYMSIVLAAYDLSVLSILAANVWGYLYGGATGGVGGKDGGGGGGSGSGGSGSNGGGAGEGEDEEGDIDSDYDPVKAFQDWLREHVLIPSIGIGGGFGNGLGYGKRRGKTYLRGDCT